MRLSSESGDCGGFLSAAHHRLSGSMADRRCAWSSKCGFCSAAHHLLSGTIADKKSGSVADRKLAWICECGLHSAAQHLLSGSIADRRCSWSSECGFCSAAHHMHTAVYKAWQIEDADGALVTSSLRSNQISRTLSG